MKPRASTTDKTKGTARTIKGRVKKAIGDLTNNPRLKREGNVDETAGRVQRKVGEIEQVFED